MKLKQYHIQWKFSGHRIETVAKVQARSLRHAVEVWCGAECYQQTGCTIRRCRRKGESWSVAKFFGRSGSVLVEGFAILGN